MTIKWPENIPTTEFSEAFVQGMADRMAVSFCKYGPIAEAFPSRVDALATLQLRLEAYARTGNTENLIDAANYALIEFLRPRHPEAHFKAEDGKASPGRRWRDEIDPTQRGNRPETWVKDFK